MESVTIADVARHAGVARGTVSNVMNRPHVVAEATRERVLEAMRDLDFVPSMSARLLAGAQNRGIGLVVHDAGNPFFSEAARGAEDIAAEHGFVISLTNTRADENRQRSSLQLLLEQRVSGVLLSPTARRDPGADRLRQNGIAVVLLDFDGDEGGCSVSVDDTGGGGLAATHLMERGIRSFAFLGGPRRVRQHDQRLRGLKKTLTARRVSVRESVQVLTVPEDTANAGFAAINDFLSKSGSMPEGLICGNDLLAIGAMRALTAHGLSIPGDVAVVGYDDIDVASLLATPLTSVRQPAYELGRAAARLLLSEIESGPRSHEHERLHFMPELVVRASSG